MNPSVIILLRGDLSAHLPQGDTWMSRQIVHTLYIYKARISKQAPHGLVLIVTMLNQQPTARA